MIDVNGVLYDVNGVLYGTIFFESP